MTRIRATAGEAVVRDLAARLTCEALSVEVVSMPVSSFTTAGFRQTAIEVLPQGVQVYRDGRLRTRPAGFGARRIATPAGPRQGSDGAAAGRQLRQVPRASE